ncbi:MAG: arginine--tRNA ligase [Bacteroidales bacterium]|nr:arginine--tRNA ligase [Bacteroidales bacterium]
MIEQQLQQAIAQALKTLYAFEAAPESIILQTTKKEFEGDFTLVVFPYVKAARKSPEMVANEIGAAVKEMVAEIASFNVIKGFLNFAIADSYWMAFMNSIVMEQNYGLKAANENAAPIVVEYSSPNTNKPLHLGHVRNNLLGWSVSQLLKASGNNVKMVNLVNDRGIHICKSMLAWMKFGNGETPETSGMKGDHLVGKYYVEFDKHFRAEVKELVAGGMEEEEAKKQAPLLLEAQAMLKKWEEGDKEIRDLWQKMNGWVYAGFDETYKKMGVGFDKIYYESNTYMLGKELVQKGLDMGVLYKREDGAVCADLTGDGLDHKVLLRKDGTSVYMTQDLGTALLRHNDFGADRLIYVVGNEQDYHFKVLKIILGRLGFDWADKVYHLSYGMVELPNGKMKSREGTVVDADDLMAEMVNTAAEMSKEHGKNDDLTPEQQNELYHMLAMGALKYFILKVDPTKNMLFNPEESIDFNGNTGPFIQYTHARIRSIVRKGEDQGCKVSAVNADGLTLNEKEREVIKKLHDLPSMVQTAAAAFSPAMVANYAFELAKLFNSFYQDTPILKEENVALKSFRINLCATVATALRNTMNILGIQVPERM